MKIPAPIKKKKKFNAISSFKSMAIARQSMSKETEKEKIKPKVSNRYRN